ncbi:MAG TPA: zinc ribbon domain-containing protein [Micromonosporaceae bacterium]
MTVRTGPADNAVGRVMMPRLAATTYLALGLLRCGLCGRTLHPARDGSGRRYACQSGCVQPGVPAVAVEQDLLLRALVRARLALYQVGRTLARLDGPPVSRAEVRRWQWCDPRDRAGMLRTAFGYVIVDWRGQLNPVWRHRAERERHTAIGGDRDAFACRVA